MRTHVIGLGLLGVCVVLLGLITRLYFAGRNYDVIALTGAFLAIIAILGVLIALVPSVRRAFTTE